MYELIESLRISGFGCYIGDSFFGCIMYADDLLLLSPSLSGIQFQHMLMLRVCKSALSCI